MARSESTIWLAKFGMICAVLLACCWVAPRAFTHLPQFPPTTTNQQQVVVFNRYFQLPALNVALVGSSLAYRLKEEFFEHVNLRNAAIPGGSSLTGLSIIGAAPALRPRVIAVEMNILDRGIDKSLYQKFKNGRQSDVFLRPLRTVAAYYQTALDDALTISESERRSMLARPAASEVSQHIETILAQWNQPLHEEDLVANANALSDLVKTLEDQGVAIWFFEVPQTLIFSQTRYAMTVHKVLDQVFGPNNRRWLRPEYPVDEMRWSDGVHLDERSALIFALALDKAISRKFTTFH